MSILGAMFSGVSGLSAQSQALGAIADNITNQNIKKMTIQCLNMQWVTLPLLH